MHAIYSAMEQGLDARPSPPVALVWDRFGNALRRADALRLDLAEVVDADPSMAPEAALSPATAAYVSAIQEAARSDSVDAEGGARMLGHLYCRYFADLVKSTA
jgi:heme oxygenase